jgi:hypothetical protein
MARPSEDRKEGCRCGKLIDKEGPRQRQVCGKLLVAREGLTIRCERCGSEHSILDLLREAIEAGHLMPDEVTKSIARAQLPKMENDMRIFSDMAKDIITAVRQEKNEGIVRQ